MHNSAWTKSYLKRLAIRSAVFTPRQLQTERPRLAIGTSNRISLREEIACKDPRSRDDASTRLMIVKLLEGAHYRVLEAEDEHGVRLVQADQPGVVIIDVSMPTWADWRRWKASEPGFNLPVLMLSGHGRSIIGCAVCAWERMTTFQTFRWSRAAGPSRRSPAPWHEYRRPTHSLCAAMISSSI